jgi:hypothetical protein
LSSSTLVETSFIGEETKNKTNIKSLKNKWVDGRMFALSVLIQRNIIIHIFLVESIKAW